VSAQHRGGRRPWRRRVPGLLVAFLAAASAVAVTGVALRGGGGDTAATGASGAALTVAGGGITRARRHRGHHRFVAARKDRAAPPVAELGPAIATAMSTPPAPRSPEVRWPGPDWAPPAWAPPAPDAVGVASAVGTAGLAGQTPAEAAPSLFLVPAPDPMVDTVPHPVVKLFPLAHLEPDLAAGSIDERVYAAIDEERRLAEASALASGRHASSTPTDAARPRGLAYRSRHSA
jgi:hypothetical protein